MIGVGVIGVDVRQQCCVWLFCTTNNVEQLLMPCVGALLLSRAYPLHSLSAAV